MENKRAHNIDVLKGICMIMVIFSHYPWTMQERDTLLFPFWIDMAVPIFMVISGYIHAKTYEKYGANSLQEVYSSKLIVKSLIRYTLPYLFIYVLQVIYYGVIMKKGMTVLDILLIFLNGGWGAGSYYYPIMVQFVFVYPVIYFIIRKYQEKGILICGFVNAMYELLQRAYFMNPECYRLLLFRYILVIAVGCYLAIGKKRVNMRCWVGLAVVSVIFNIAHRYAGYKPVIITEWTTTSWLGSMYIFPFAVRFLNNRGIKCKILEVIGKASYNIFLIQMWWFALGNPLYEIITSKSISILVDVTICVSIGIIFYYTESRITKAFLRRMHLVD